jgi:thymidylate synthase (FAD)
MDDAASALIGKTFPVLDGQGFIRLIDVLGNDAAVCRAARVSTGAEARDDAGDRRLIRSLVRRAEMSPFEFAGVVLHVRVPLYVWAQWKRYRHASIGEYSTRYREAIAEMHATPPDGWRLQAEGRKQGSGGPVTDWPAGYSVEGYYEGLFHRDDETPAGKLVEVDDPETGRGLGVCVFEAGQEPTPGAFLSRREGQFQEAARALYAERLAFGVAREQARKDLPVSSFTEAFWKIDLRNLLHVLHERLGHAAQAEFRAYAEAIAREVVAPLFPHTWGAFRDYVLDAVTLSALDAGAVRSIVAGRPAAEVLAEIANVAERAECREKLARLGLIDDARGTPAA